MEDASSWDRWVTLFEDAGYMGAPGWPGDPETVATQRRPAQPRELEPRGPTQLRAVPLQVRERSRRGRGERTVPV